MPLRPDFARPYASARSPVMGRNVVATSQPLAAQAGLRMLLKGGNAVDAAIAAAMTLVVVEPSGCGLGSDAFAILWDGESCMASTHRAAPPPAGRRSVSPGATPCLSEAGNR